MSRWRRLRDSTQIDEALIDAVGQVAPALGTSLAGPLGGVVAGQIATRVLGVDPKDGEAMIKGLAALSPDQRAELMRLEGEASVSRARIAAEDRADARASHGDSWMPAVLSLLSFVALVAAFGALLFAEPPDTGRDMLMAVIGYLIAVSKDGFGFYLGSSAGSKSKEAGIIARMR